mmetsp:Transcript_19625/g.52064  ORF Transcript_19625/g.52064 Transcript_19625/m.52064 type:complete len:596 (+) Transcript_19625:193-1980(+)
MAEMKVSINECAAPRSADAAPRDAAVASLLDDVEQPAILIDVALPNFPIVAVSAGYLALTACTIDDIVGQGVDVLTSNVPKAYRSKSARTDQTDYLRHCGSLSSEGVIAETRIVQQALRKDGSMYTTMNFFGLSVLSRKRYVLVCMRNIGENLGPRLTAAALSEHEEEMRSVFRDLRWTLRRNLAAKPRRGRDPANVASDATSRGSFGVDGSDGWGNRRQDVLDSSGPIQPFAFYDARLQHHCVLRNRYTVERREPNEIANNCCMVFSNRPLNFSEVGLTFAVKVDKSADFMGLPFLGITTREPEDTANLYPTVAKGLGASTMAGGVCEAHHRSKSDHFQIGFKVPPVEEVQTWQCLPKNGPVPCVVAGDVLTLIHTWAGRLQLLKNGETFVDVETGHPLDTGCVHYAFVDVCFSAATLSVLPNEPGCTAYGKPHEICKEVCADSRQKALARCAAKDPAQQARIMAMLYATRTMASLETVDPFDDAETADNNDCGTETVASSLNRSVSCAGPSVGPIAEDAEDFADAGADSGKLGERARSSAPSVAGRCPAAAEFLASPGRVAEESWLPWQKVAIGAMPLLAIGLVCGMVMARKR